MVIKFPALVLGLAVSLLVAPLTARTHLAHEAGPQSRELGATRVTLAGTNVVAVLQGPELLASCEGLASPMNWRRA